MGEVRVTQKFAADFGLVTGHYKLVELGELEEAKAAARRDMPGAIVAFASMAARIRLGMA